jgi:SAM-dependent MidA family methyltransferase
MLLVSVCVAAPRAALASQAGHKVAGGGVSTAVLVAALLPRRTGLLACHLATIESLMTELAALIREEIDRGGSISFRRYMELALYHPEYGYYRRPRDPFGRSGDFFTAEQLQPVFGILIATRVRSLFADLGDTEGLTVVELGAGRGEMAEAFMEMKYIPVELDRGELPESFDGCVFSNEFFDALPVEVAVCRSGVFRELRVGWSGERFAWVESDPVDAEAEEYIARYTALREEDNIVEVNREALRWIERIVRHLRRGFVFTIDYGYTARESIRFPQGTLMSYRRHQAIGDVLTAPGERDITAHVPFTALEEHGKRNGLETVRFETLARTLLDAGEPDNFLTALDAPSDTARMRRRMQLKTLLFGMGETFRVLIQRKR